MFKLIQNIKMSIVELIFYTVRSFINHNLDLNSNFYNNFNQF